MLPEQDELVENLHRKYFGKLTVYAASALGKSSKAQDVVQDAFRELLRHMDSDGVRENPGGWLMLTVKNKVKEEKRARQRYIHRFVSLDTDIPGELIPASELAIELHEPGDTLPMEKIERALTTEEFRLLTRLTLDNASHLEVAQEFNISVDASAKRLQRIREKLYEVFPERKKKKKK